MAERISDVAELVVRVRALSLESIRAATRSGGVVVVRGEAAWIVVVRGRATIVSDTEESRERLTARTLRRHAGGLRVSGIIVEPRLGLQPMSGTSLHSKRPWARLGALLALERADVLALTLYSAVIGALSLGVPVAVQVLVNTIAFGGVEPRSAALIPEVRSEQTGIATMRRFSRNPPHGQTGRPP